MRRLSPLVLLWPAALASQADTTRRDTIRLAPTVVTVTRLPTEIERAPYAVGVTDKTEIQRGKPGFALDEALAGIAGVQVDNRFNYALGERISIRGFGARAQFGVRGVRIVLDGIPMTLADGQTSLNNVDVATLARAEVIRGPASALHGNASGGVIQLETDHGDDLSRQAGIELRTTVGSDGLVRYQLASRHVSGPQFASVSASRLSFDGYRDWNTAQNDHVNFQVGRFFRSGALTLLGNWVAYDADNPGSLPIDSARLKPDMAWPANKNTFRTGEEGKQGQYGVTWKQAFRGMELHLSGHALQRHVDNPIPQRIVVIDRNAGGARVSLSGEPMLGSRPVRFAVGTEYQLQRDDRQNFINSGGSRGADTLDQLERVRNLAVFGQLSADLASRLRAMAGLRYDQIDFEADDRLIGAGNPDDSGERAMSAVSPSVGLTLRVMPMLDLYSNFSTSFETPTTSELANQESGAGGFNPILEPQTTRSIELGANGRLNIAGIAGNYQLAAYDARVSDALIPFEVASLPGRQYFRNAGSTKNRGVEVGTTLVFPASLSLRGTFTHTDARFDKYSVTVGPTTTVFDGKRVPGVAANRADATLRFQPGRAFVDFESRAQSRIPVNDANTARADSYIVHNARVGLANLTFGPASFTPSVGVMNVFDRAYMTSVVVNAFGGRFFEPGPPRSVYGGLVARF